MARKQFTKHCARCGNQFQTTTVRTKYCRSTCHLVATLDPQTRFNSKVDRNGPNGCWIWIGGRTHAYGFFTVQHGVQVRAHRWAWEQCNGPIPQGMFVCHKCDTPLCVNPGHLFLGTLAQNHSDMVSKKRHNFGLCHPMRKLSESDVLEIRRSPDSQAKAARRFGVSRATIWNIRSGKQWRHLLPPDGVDSVVHS